MYEFDMSKPSEIEKRKTLMGQMFGSVGENVWIGNPCKPVRKIDRHDKEYYWKDRRFDG